MQNPAPRPSNAGLIIAFFLIYVIWGSTYLAIRFAVETLPPYMLAAIRFLIAGAILFGIAKIQRAPKPSLRDWKIAAIVGGLLLTVGNGLVVWAEQEVPSGLTGLLLAATPLWMVLGDWWFGTGKRPSLPVIAGLGLGFGGMALLVSVSDAASARADIPWSGIIALWIATIAWAAGSLYAKIARGGHIPKGSLLQTPALEMLCAGVFLAIIALVKGELHDFDPALVSMRSLFSLAYLIFIGSLLGFTAYAYLLQNTTPARASTYAYVNPVIAVVLGWALAGEVLNSQMVIAMAVILSGVMLIVSNRGRGKA